MDSSPKVTSFTADEYLAVGAIVEKYFRFADSEKEPQFFIYVGGIGVGKTTLRRQEHGNEIVHFDPGAISVDLSKVFGKEHQRLKDYVSLGTDIVFKDAIRNKRSMAIEVTGNEIEPLRMVINKVTAIGYKVQFRLVECDIAEAYRRHHYAVETDPDYLSAYYLQDATCAPFIDYDLSRILENE